MMRVDDKARPSRTQADIGKEVETGGRGVGRLLKLEDDHWRREASRLIV
jgi:hypothetical protein